MKDLLIWIEGMFMYTGPAYRLYLRFPPPAQYYILESGFSFKRRQASPGPKEAYLLAPNLMSQVLICSLPFHIVFNTC